ncbi:MULTISPECIES: hypothetical protein [Methanobacterium]|uniref:Uncharacterized protein n=1 Tax=Methanobacterium bryantii TaxID=2161 RepID=A0A2A2H841_METBR|nr:MULTISPECIES: hypothetical protein [Methanobacterium]OEC84359.1 hypothetical protein A9507_15790 [Methanobacterium sp. A39]PAV05515.1 hypothetical protein ASJ80_09065 [Methanobacterium bryantii]
MNKTLVLFLAFIVTINVSLGVSAAAAQDSNDVGNITIDSYNLNLDPNTNHQKDPGKTLPLQKTGLPVVPALLSILLVLSGSLYVKIRK